MTRPSAQDVKTKVAARLRMVREGMGLSQDAFATRMGISQTRYSKYESGRSQPPFDVLIAISDLTGQTLDFLIAGRSAHMVVETDIGPAVGTARPARWP